jgi:hypothetical protein
MQLSYRSIVGWHQFKSFKSGISWLNLFFFLQFHASRSTIDGIILPRESRKVLSRCLATSMHNYVHVGTEKGQLRSVVRMWRKLFIWLPSNFKKKSFVKHSLSLLIHSSNNFGMKRSKNFFEQCKSTVERKKTNKRWIIFLSIVISAASFCHVERLCHHQS